MFGSHPFLLYLIYVICGLAHSGVQHILCYGLFSSSCIASSRFLRNGRELRQYGLTKRFQLNYSLLAYANKYKTMSIGKNSIKLNGKIKKYNKKIKKVGKKSEKMSTVVTK